MSSPATANGSEEVSLARRPGKKPKRPMSAYNFFYRDERERVLSQQAQQQLKPQEREDGGNDRKRKRPEVEGPAPTIVTDASSSSGSSGRVSTNSNSRTSSTSMNTVSSTASSSRASTAASLSGVDPLSNSEADNSDEGDQHPTSNKEPQLQIQQHSNLTFAGIATLVEHQNTFRDMGREIGKRWKEIGVRELDRYQKLAEKDAERYQRELREYEEEQKLREKIVNKYYSQNVHTSTVDIGKTSTIDVSVNSSTCESNGGHNAMPYNTTGPTLSSWPNQQQMVQQTQHPILAISQVQQQQQPPHLSNFGDGLLLQLPVIAQLLQNQQQLLGTHHQQQLQSPTTAMSQQSPPASASIDFSNLFCQPSTYSLPLPTLQQPNVAMCGQGKTGLKYPDTHSNHVVQLLMQQNQLLQDEVMQLLKKEAAQTQVIQQLQNPTRQEGAASHTGAMPPSSTAPTSTAFMSSESETAKNPSKSAQTKTNKLTLSKKRSKARPRKAMKIKKKKHSMSEDVISIDEVSKSLLSLRSSISGDTCTASGISNSSSKKRRLNGNVKASPTSNLPSPK